MTKRRLPGSRWTDDERCRLLTEVEIQLANAEAAINWYLVARRLNGAEGSRSSQACKQMCRAVQLTNEGKTK